AIHQHVTLPATPARVYAALTDSRQFSAFTGGAKAEIESAAGGAFSCFGGMISGRMIELVPGKRLVQAWRAGNWPEGVYSIVRFELAGDGPATRLVLDQNGHPADAEPHLES